MITRYRCQSCYTEFENAEADSKCQKCGIDAFQIGQREEPAPSAPDETGGKEAAATATAEVK